ncbi:BON domain-containing protein [Pseudomonas mangiferae]|uniref:Osmotically-inducible protein Y n=1 Tax=Pseudomonas mangiferae TaxID=2593654 RepID=A0A553GXA9_9PSED|nr:BON domain-containing protein [Pseudomonas mangiferae]TRX74105.1 BON domain-containing protein [Pseudomonas mangiferae]
MTKTFNIFALATAAALTLSANGAFAAQQNTQAPMVVAANTVDKTEEAVSDTWITSKVKSTFLAEKDLSALDIKVETNKGVVSLSGTVATDAQRELAVAKTKTIKGVKAVSADGLKSAD